jgi:hypothetical protein
MVTVIIGGAGNDSFYVGGDVLGTVVALDIDGVTGTVDHLVAATTRRTTPSGSRASSSTSPPHVGQFIVTERPGGTVVYEPGEGVTDGPASGRPPPRRTTCS